MPTIEQIMQYAMGKKKINQSALNQINIPNPNDISNIKPDNEFIKNLILNESFKSIIGEPAKPQSMMSNQGLDIINDIYPNRPVQPKMDMFGKIELNEPIETIKTKPIQQIPITSSPLQPLNIETLLGTAKPIPTEKTLLEQIQERNKSLQRKTNALNMGKVLDDASSLLTNLNEPDGIAPVESVHLVSPQIQYDDTLRQKIANEAMKQGQITQSNAMKLGMGALIPAIQNNTSRATNEVNTQAQAQLNQIQQQNELAASQTANNEQAMFVQQREKIIADGLQKNAMRYEAIGKSKDALFQDLQNNIDQNQKFSEEEIKSKVYQYIQEHPGMTDEQQLQLLIRFGVNTGMLDFKNSGGTKKSSKGTIKINDIEYDITPSK